MRVQNYLLHLVGQIELNCTEQFLQHPTIFMQSFNEKSIATKATRNKNGKLEICPVLFLLKPRDRLSLLAQL